MAKGSTCQKQTVAAEQMSIYDHAEQTNKLTTLIIVMFCIGLFYSPHCCIYFTSIFLPTGISPSCLSTSVKPTTSSGFGVLVLFTNCRHASLQLCCDVTRVTLAAQTREGNR